MPVYIGMFKGMESSIVEACSKSQIQRHSERHIHKRQGPRGMLGEVDMSIGNLERSGVVRKAGGG